MKRSSYPILVALLLLPALSRGQTVWTNPVFGVITDTTEIPQSVNNFINHGFIGAAGLTLAPVEIFDLQNITNTGLMLGSPGWRFNNVSSSTGTRRMSANFVNLNAGVISSIDPLVSSATCAYSILDPSYLYVWATNIINRSVGTNGASLTVGANGGLDLNGRYVDLFRSGLEVRPIWLEPQGSTTTDVDGEPVSFTPDIAVYDNYWAQDSFTEQDPFGSGGLWDGTVANAPGIPMPPSQPIPSTPFTLVFPAADSYISFPPNTSGFLTITNIVGDPTNVTDVIITNVFVASNVVKGAVFASAPPQFGIQLGFFQDTGGNLLLTPEVLFLASISNAVTATNDVAGLYIWDTLGDTPDDRGFRVNELGCPPNATSRPVNYYVDRLAFLVGGPGNNGYPEPDFFTSSRSRTLNEPENYGMDAVTNAVVEEGDYAGYSAFFDNVVTRPPTVPGGTITNQPGRIRIQADELDMSRTRIRAEGELVIDAAHLISSTNAIVDAESLSFNLTSTNGNLRVQNLSKDFVQRLRGSIYAWSATWENTAVMLITNNWAVSNVVTTNDMGVEVTNVVGTQVPITNDVSITYHVLMVDGSQLQTVLPVNVYDVHTRSTNVVINDNMSIVQSLLIDGESFTLNGALTIPGAHPPDPITGLVPLELPLRSWVGTNAPDLRLFTNNGSLSVASVANFGEDRVVPYETFVNIGSVSAVGILLESDYFENRGALQAFGGLFMNGGIGNLDGGSSISGDLTRIQAGDVKLNNYQLSSGGSLDLRITNSLSDAGPASGSLLNATFGFNLLVKPDSGDLLGTTLRSVAPQFWQTEHSWAGEDRGNSVLGYSNNTAVGTFVLSTSDNFGGHFLRGTGSQNALYVDLLDLSSLGANYEEELTIDPSLTIYYAAARIGPSPPPNTLPEEFLDRAFGGRLVWVRDFAGPNSSIDVLVNGQTVKVNRALRNSRLIDSDEDGIPNFFDPNPFDPVLAPTIALTNMPPMAVAVSWQAAANTVYRIETSTSANSGSWTHLAWLTNSAASARVSVCDTNSPAGGNQRYYRVRVWP